MTPVGNRVVYDLYVEGSLPKSTYHYYSHDHYPSESMCMSWPDRDSVLEIKSRSWPLALTRFD